MRYTPSGIVVPPQEFHLYLNTALYNELRDALPDNPTIESLITVTTLLSHMAVGLTEEGLDDFIGVISDIIRRTAPERID